MTASTSVDAISVWILEVGNQADGHSSGTQLYTEAAWQLFVSSACWSRHGSCKLLRHCQIARSVGSWKYMMHARMYLAVGRCSSCCGFCLSWCCRISCQLRGITRRFPGLRVQTWNGEWHGHGLAMAGLTCCIREPCLADKLLAAEGRRGRGLQGTQSNWLVAGETC